MSTYDVTLLTAKQYLNPSEPDWYIQQILREDLLLRTALEKKGLRVHRTDWTNREFHWSETKAVVLRAVWDYQDRYDEFTAFLNLASLQSVLINPLQTILWNLDKHYLRDMNTLGIRVPETIYIEKSERITLHQLHRQNNLSETILKPVMSAGARHTYRLNKQNLSQHEQIFQNLIAAEAMMVQPFLHDVIINGEITLVVIGGKYTHSVLKKTKSGDFRVQDDFGGTVHPYSPSQEEIIFAEKAVSVCTPIPLYARVDLLRDHSNKLVLSELELIEPELWFRFHPPAADIFADVIFKFL